MLEKLPVCMELDNELTCSLKALVSTAELGIHSRSISNEVS